ncbi:prepilin peptidase [Lentzea sp. NPDC051838]|uniref:prepilin peptidase n=1 Tax=Lentzea sp. NPDC051838 TaxID=3154849 RepID=UPI0034321395
MITLSYSLLGVVSGPLVMLAGFSIAQREPMSWRLFASVGWATSLAASPFLGFVLTYAALAVPQSAGLVAWLVIVGSTLALVDWTCHLLPHRVVGTLLVGGLAQISLTALVLRDFEPLLRAAVAAAAVFSAGLLVYLRLGADLGFGDVTLATALALHLGWRGWSYVFLGLTAGLLVAWAAIRTLFVVRRIGHRDPVALGPALLAGAVYAMLQA